MKLYQYKNFLKDLLFPVSCLGCSEGGVYLCDKCIETIPRYNDTFVDWLDGNQLDRVVIAADYNNKTLQYAIHSFKYKFLEEIGERLGELFSGSKIKEFRGYLLVPIPLHQKRLKWREFNQSQVLGETLCKKYGLKADYNVLVRQKNITAQMKLKRRDRLKNVHGAFAIKNEQVIKGKNILLVDDVITTSATLNEAAIVLKKAGAKRVVGLVLAHG